jgi:hypothetical protein
MSVLASATLTFQPRQSGFALLLRLENGEVGSFDLPLPVALELNKSCDVALHHSECLRKGVLPVAERVA